MDLNSNDVTRPAVVVEDVFGTVGERSNEAAAAAAEGVRDDDDDDDEETPFRAPSWLCWFVVDVAVTVIVAVAVAFEEEEEG